MRQIISISLLLIHFYSSATTTDYSASADSYIQQNLATTNYGSATDMYTYPWTGVPANRRSMVRFDLSAIPNGSTITSATLKLTETGTQGSARTLAVHRLTKNWTNAGVTWNKYDGVTDWTAAGGDYAAATATNAITWTASYKTDTWDVTTDVDNFVNNATANYGWLVKDNSEDDSQQFWMYGTVDNVTSANRPVLTVVYVLPVTFLNYYATVFKDAAKINWSTATETNNEFFTIERTETPAIKDAFVAVGKVEGAGTSNNVHTYAFMDETVNAHHLYYYRIKQTDYDGKFDYSPVFYAHLNEDADIIVVTQPNGLVDFIASGFDETPTFELYSSTGQLLATQKSDSFQYLLLPNKVYIIKASDGIIERRKKVAISKE
jgi:hypothetical protein